MSIHQVIREGRRRLGMSEQQFAETLGVSRGAVQHWEKAGGTAPQRKTQPRVAKLLGISIAELLTGTQSMSGDERAKTEVPVLAEFQVAPMRSVDNFGGGKPSSTVRSNVAVGRHTYAVRIGSTGLTYEQQDAFSEGTIVVVEPDLEPVPGDYVIVLEAGAKTPTLRQLVGSGRNLYLRPLDRQIPATAKGSQPILGVVREALRRFR